MDAQQVSEFQFAGQDLPVLLAHWARVKPDHPFLIWEPRTGAGRQWTYRQFHDDVRAVAAGLHARGVKRGDRILIHSENCPEMVLGWYACATLGAVGVTTNTRSVSAEINYFADHTGCVGAITQPQFAGSGGRERTRSGVDRGHRGQQRRAGPGRAARPRAGRLRLFVR